MAQKIHDAASEVAAEQGEVMIEGPGGVSVSLTANAAHETSRRLEEEARKAEEQCDAELPKD